MRFHLIKNSSNVMLSFIGICTTPFPSFFAFNFFKIPGEFLPISA